MDPKTVVQIDPEVLNRRLAERWAAALHDKLAMEIVVEGLQAENAELREQIRTEIPALRAELELLRRQTVETDHESIGDNAIPEEGYRRAAGRRRRWPTQVMPVPAEQGAVSAPDVTNLHIGAINPDSIAEAISDRLLAER